MYSVELFLGRWSNTIGLLNGLASFLIAWLIFRAEQRISEDKTRYLFLSVLHEAGMQLDVIKRFSASLNSAINWEEWQTICKKKNDSLFLSAVYTAKKSIGVTRFRPSLRKFHSYQGIFDEYRAKKIALWRRGKKVDVDVFCRYLEDFEKNIMKECFRIQKEISCLLPNFTVLFRGDASDVAKLVNMMDKYSTQEVFASELSKSDCVFAPDWEKAAKVGVEMEKYAADYAKICENADNMLQGFCQIYGTSLSSLSAQANATRG